MNTENKKTYVVPEIELVKLDNEISLALESTPPSGPFESKNTEQIRSNDDHFYMV